MIFSEQKIFAYKQEITLANNATSNNVVLTNEIDLGASQKPYRVKRALRRNIGDGDPIPIMAIINSTNTAALTEFHFYLQTSLTGGDWTTIHSGRPFRNARVPMHIHYVPNKTIRYLRMWINYKQNTATAGKKIVVTSAIGTYHPSQLDGL